VPELAAARRVVETCELLLARVDGLRAKILDRLHPDCHRDQLT
jgi:hypothetical protein